MMKNRMCKQKMKKKRIHDKKGNEEDKEEGLKGI